MFDGIDSAEDWLESWTANVSAEAERTAELSRRVAALTAVAESADRSIKVTVGSAGQTERLDLDDRVQRLSGEELARQIMAVMRKAQAALSTQVTEQVTATVGADTEAGRAIIHSFGTRFPQQEEDDETERGAGHGR